MYVRRHRHNPPGTQMGATDALRRWCSHHAGEYRGMEGRARVDRRENRRGHRRLVQISGRREKPGVTKIWAMDFRRIVLLGHSGFVGYFDRDDPWNMFSRVSLEDLLGTMRDGETLDAYVVILTDRCQ